MPDVHDDRIGSASSPAIPHITERDRAIRAVLLGVALGVFLRFVSRRRSA
jgi:hypothetical protein